MKEIQMRRSGVTLFIALFLGSLAHGQITTSEQARDQLNKANQFTSEQVREQIRKYGGLQAVLRHTASSIVPGQKIPGGIVEITGAEANANRITYYHRLMNEEKSDIPPIPEARRLMASKHASTFCPVSMLSLMIKEHGAEIRYVVAAKSGGYLFEYTFNKATCAPDYRW